MSFGGNCANTMTAATVQLLTGGLEQCAGVLQNFVRVSARNYRINK